MDHWGPNFKKDILPEKLLWKRRKTEDMIIYKSTTNVKPNLASDKMKRRNTISEFKLK